MVKPYKSGEEEEGEKERKKISIFKKKEHERDSFELSRMPF